MEESDAGRDSRVRWSPRVSRALNAEAVYGTVLTAGLISAFSLYDPTLPELIVRTVGTVVVFWAAHVYAEIVGNRETGWRPAIREALERSAGLLWALVVPLGCLAVAAALQLSTSQAVDVAVGGAVAALAVLGWWAARQRHAGELSRLITSAATAGMGFALIILKALIH